MRGWGGIREVTLNTSSNYFLVHVFPSLYNLAVLDLAYLSRIYSLEQIKTKEIRHNIIKIENSKKSNPNYLIFFFRFHRFKRYSSPNSGFREFLCIDQYYWWGTYLYNILERILVAKKLLNSEIPSKNGSGFPTSRNNNSLRVTVPAAFPSTNNIVSRRKSQKSMKFRHIYTKTV